MPLKKRYANKRSMSVSRLVPPGQYDVECTVYRTHVYQATVKPGDVQYKICGVCGAPAKFHARGWMDKHHRGDDYGPGAYEGGIFSNPLSEGVKTALIIGGVVVGGAVLYRILVSPASTAQPQQTAGTPVAATGPYNQLGPGMYLVPGETYLASINGNASTLGMSIAQLTTATSPTATVVQSWPSTQRPSNWPAADTSTNNQMFSFTFTGYGGTTILQFGQGDFLFSTNGALSGLPVGVSAMRVQSGFTRPLISAGPAMQHVSVAPPPPQAPVTVPCPPRPSPQQLAYADGTFRNCVNNSWFQGVQYQYNNALYVPASMASSLSVMNATYTQEVNVLRNPGTSSVSTYPQSPLLGHWLVSGFLYNKKSLLPSPDYFQGPFYIAVPIQPGIDPFGAATLGTVCSWWQHLAPMYNGLVSDPGRGPACSFWTH